MNWDGLPNPHRAVLMEGAPFGGLNCEGFTAMCLVSHELGMAGPAECYVLGYSNTEASRIRLAVHILSCNCGWSHVL